MHKNQNQSIEIMLTCVGSFSFPANHLFIQGYNQKSDKNIMKNKKDVETCFSKWRNLTTARKA
jgi:hypothetical protein